MRSGSAIPAARPGVGLSPSGLDELEQRTPPTSICAISKILLDNSKLELAQRKDILGIITKGTTRLPRLINRVPDLAKIESGAAEWQESSANMKEFIADALAGMSQSLPAKNIPPGARRPA